MSATSKNRNFTVAGIGLTAAVTVFFLWAGYQWMNRHNWPRPLTVRGRQANEIKAFENLKLISQAQEKYRQADWDGDGKKTYAQFYIHLWRSVDGDSKPISVGLISRELGFAMGPSRPIEGYYFVDIHYRSVDTKVREKRKLNHESEWAVAAVPIGYKHTGRIAFLADDSGGVFARGYTDVPSKCPAEPVSAGWNVIESVRELEEFQRTFARGPD